jgi:hypothetical protein
MSHGEFGWSREEKGKEEEEEEKEEKEGKEGKEGKKKKKRVIRVNKGGHRTCHPISLILSANYKIFPRQPGIKYKLLGNK